MVMERGAIFWCDFEQGGIRPAIIISADGYNLSKSPLVAVVVLTKAAPKSPLQVELGPAETGLKTTSTVLVDQLKFVDRERLKPGLIGRLTPAALAKVEGSLSRILGLAE